MSECCKSNRVFTPANGDVLLFSGEMRNIEPSERFTKTAPSIFDLSNIEAKFCLASEYVITSMLPPA